MTDQIHGPPQADGVALRPAETVIPLVGMGAGFQTRLSFMRSLVRRMSRERWRVERELFELDDDGYGTVVYRVITPERCYSLVGFSHYLEPEQRTDRVIAEAWDATFSLFDGIPEEHDVERLRKETPRQDAGRCRESELVMSRANKSLRLFDYVTESLAAGRQPDPEVLGEVGYLMRTTAVYGNGKFGMSDRTRYAERPELAGPFRAELLTVFLIRGFTLDLIEHVARRRNPDGFVPLDPAIKRSLGIGNATGLGMAPFLISHPLLIHNWYHARETALAVVRSLERITPAAFARFRAVLARATRHVAEWAVADALQSERIVRLRRDLAQLEQWTREPHSEHLSGALPWDGLYRRAEAAFSLEGQELLVSLLLEPYPELVDELGEHLEANEDQGLEAGMTVAELRALLERSFTWALTIDFSRPEESQYFWYSSEEKLEPRRGERRCEPGAEKEMPLAIARDAQLLHAALRGVPDDQGLPVFLLRHPEFRHIAQRVQITARRPYSEIRDNLIGESCRPIDILRSKLAYFGAGKFDPKSDLWTRITMYQGAPLADELAHGMAGDDADDWCFPVMPAAQGS